MTDTKKLVAEVRELDATATAGPWEWERRGIDGDVATLFSPPTMTGGHYLNLVNTQADEWDHNGAANRTLIARYRTLAPQLAEALERVEDRLEHTQQWYAERCERLWHWAHEDKEHRSGYFAIMANGTETIHEPPTYAQQMNTLRHALERSEDTAQRQAAEIVIGMRKNNRLKAENARLREALAAVCDALDVRLGDSDLDGDGSAEFRAFSNARDLLAKTEVDDG